MLKSALVLALFAAIPFAQAYEINVWNDAGKKISLFEDPGFRTCICLKNTQSAKIYNKDGGDVKLFSTSDCTGNFSPLVVGKTQSNAQWVNSLSIGKSGIPSSGPLTCPNYFNV
ncbi:hypothetical protein F5H01DRAFT_123894 [Linnemannia elongata]|nr:hypothetical protein F5H01DRAFT_123894 [Linnemannia elongata]